MRNRNIIVVSIFSFIIGCKITLNFMNVEKCICPDAELYTTDKKQILDPNDNINYVVIIFSRPWNVQQRTVIRDTWLKLIDRADEPLRNGFKHYFVVGISSLNDELRIQLRRESETYNDLLILPHLEDRYSTLTKKLIQSFKWLRDTFKNLLYVVKCDDDSFVRVDVIVTELYQRKNQVLVDSKSSVKFSSKTGKLEKTKNIGDTGLYWGYFKGNAHIRKKGSWAEMEWFLCDRYLPYALGGGYVLSVDVIQFISDNYNYLKLYNSEDISLGVWTAPLSRLHRQHDVRFDTEWSSRGCINSHIIRHKQNTENIIEMYDNLVKTNYKELCKHVYEHRKSYEYNWKTLPGHCCKPNESFSNNQ